MEILIRDCLPPIFSYLSISDLLHLRLVSRRFKQEVGNYFPYVRSLPLFLTTPRSPEWNARFEQVIQSSRNYNPIPKLSNNLTLNIHKLRFSTFGQETFEDGTILHNQNHFRLDNFLIFNSSLKLAACLQFIQKHCPNIEKLALLIDDRVKYLPEVSCVLEAFPAVKVLLIESTLKDACRYGDSTSDCSNIILLWDYQRVTAERVILPPEVYDSIQAMNNLEELYLFSKRQSELSLTVDETKSFNFIESMLRRLRVLHYNTFMNTFRLPVDKLLLNEDYGLLYGRLEELACSVVEWSSRWKHAPIFRKLKKLILLDDPAYSLHKFFGEVPFPVFPGPEIKVLDITKNNVIISMKTMDIFAAFPLLERLHCRQIFIPIDTEMLDYSPINTTIKHLQVLTGPETTEDRKKEVKRYSEHFLALETCVFLEPEYSEIRVADLRN